MASAGSSEISSRAGLPAAIPPHAVRSYWLQKREVAVLDLRGEHVHAQAHPLFATSVPFADMEMRILAMVPVRSTPIVLIHGSDRIVVRAAEVLARLGYSNVGYLAGGVEAWARAGYQLFADVNSPSKAFGELVAEEKDTPLLPAPRLKQMIDEGADLAILDVRTPGEYMTMRIPGGQSLPGGDLVRNARHAAGEAGKTIIVNCAGRTRGIIGAQSLINAGTVDKVYALRNGTIGWTLEGFDLARGVEGALLPELGEPSAAEAKASSDVAYRAGVRRITMGELAALGEDVRTTFRFDLRPLEQYRAGYIPGFVPMAGGQLVQETETWTPVRGARIVLYDDAASVRANMTGSWLAQMGWDCLVLEFDATAHTETGDHVAPVPETPPVAEIAPHELARRQDDDTVIIDLGPSDRLAGNAVPNSVLVMRDRLAEFAAAHAGRTIVLVSRDGVQAAFAAGDLPGRDVRVLQGGREGWRRAGMPFANGPTAVFGEADDIYRRPYVGADNPAEKMQAYLEWEYGLVAQLRKDGSHGFFVV